jgi:hypothetical protein
MDVYHVADMVLLMANLPLENQRPIPDRHGHLISRRDSFASRSSAAVLAALTSDYCRSKCNRSYAARTATSAASPALPKSA